LETILEPSFAGSFYPADPLQLAGLVKSLTGTHEPSSRGIGMVVPHAGMAYSGKTAGMAYRIAPDGVERVILCAPSHRVFVGGAVILDADALGTPMGNVKVDGDAVGSLERFGLKRARFGEHSLEVQLPFILDRWPEAKVVPLITGSFDPVFLEELACFLHAETEGAFFIASSDLSHFHRLEHAEKLDSMVREAFLSLSPEKFISSLDRGGEACGRAPMLALLHYAARAGGSLAREIHYSTSADAGAGRTQVVGYFSAMISRKGDD
jgi:hypothetical protein